MSQLLPSSHAAVVVAPRTPRGSALTPREIDVALLLSEGQTNKQIARQLGISDFTVRDHVSRLLGKFEAKSRTRLAAVLSAGQAARR